MGVCVGWALKGGVRVKLKPERLGAYFTPELKIQLTDSRPDRNDLREARPEGGMNGWTKEMKNR